MSLLSRIRKQVYELIHKNSSVIDIGCGKGHLLRELSDKISYGLGIDINKRKINFANKRKLDNLKFEVINSKDLELKEKFDIAISMFVIHSVDYQTQIKTLKNMSKIAKQIILIDLIWPDSFINKTYIYLEEHLAGHYKQFQDYKKIGMEKLISDSGLKLSKKMNGVKDMYKIWICENPNL